MIEKHRKNFIILILTLIGRKSFCFLKKKQKIGRKAGTKFGEMNSTCSEFTPQYFDQFCLKHFKIFLLNLHSKLKP